MASSIITSARKPCEYKEWDADERKFTGCPYTTTSDRELCNHHTCQVGACTKIAQTYDKSLALYMCIPSVCRNVSDAFHDPVNPFASSVDPMRPVRKTH